MKPVSYWSISANLIAFKGTVNFDLGLHFRSSQRGRITWQIIVILANVSRDVFLNYCRKKQTSKLLLLLTVRHPPRVTKLSPSSVICITLVI